MFQSKSMKSLWVYAPPPSRIVRSCIVRAHPNLEPRQIFQCKPPRQDITFEEVREAVRATRCLDVDDRRAYFSAQGMDYDRVQKYYWTVWQLEEDWRASGVPSSIDAMEALKLQSVIAWNYLRTFAALLVHILMV